MTPRVLQQLEQLCESAIPAEYLALLDHYPEVLLFACRADDGSDSEDVVSGVELLASEEHILEINQEVRLGTILDPEGLEFRWPDRLLVIGETGSGDYYCVDTDGEHSGVLQFRHYSVEFEVIADSLDEFIDMLMNAFVTRSFVEDEENEDEHDDDELRDAEPKD